MAPRHNQLPTIVVEVLRLCVVAFFATVGFQIGTGFDEDVMVGGLDGPSLGVVLGGTTGYVLGGTIARLTLISVTRAESQLTGRSAEQLLAGLIGAVFSVVAATCLAWPILMIGAPTLNIPLFVFILVTIGSLGYRLGYAQRLGVLSLLGQSGRFTAGGPSSAAVPALLDSSVAVDGRIIEIIKSGFLNGRLLLPEVVLGELQSLADSEDEQRRHRGRRGLEVLQDLRQQRGVDLELIPDPLPADRDVDGFLVDLAREQDAALLTLDSNLAKVAVVAGCRVLNLHALTLAMRPPVVAGEQVVVQLTRAGKEPGQAVGHLDDGTMVVVDKGRRLIGSEAQVVVSSVLITANGRMVFARTTGAPATVPAPTRSPG